MVDDYKADLLSSRAFLTGYAKMCGRCDEFWTVNRSGVCPTCIQILTDNRIEEETAIGAQEAAWAAEDAAAKAIPAAWRIEGAAESLPVGELFEEQKKPTIPVSWRIEGAVNSFPVNSLFAEENR